MATSAHAHTLRTASGLTFALSLDDHRLALVGLVDFEGRWDILEAAAGQVVDGAAKAKRVRQHLLPIAEHLPLLADDLDALRLWTARRWFASQLCQETGGSRD